MPSENPLSTAKAFLREHIRSVEQLEILLLVSSARRELWTVRDVNDVILSSETSVAHWLEALAAQGLLLRDEGPPLVFRHATDPALAAQISELQLAYKTAPVRIIEAIYQKDADAAQSFADAFKFKQPPSS